jgi:hypothetical protein
MLTRIIFCLKNAVFWDMAPCRYCVNRRFWGTYSLQSAATCSRWFLARGFFYPEDGGDTFLRDVGSHKIYMAPLPRRRHSSQSPPWIPQILHIRFLCIVTNMTIVRQLFVTHIPPATNESIVSPWLVKHIPMATDKTDQCTKCWKWWSIFGSPGSQFTSGQFSRKGSPCGGGIEYLHRDPASRRRRRKGKSQIWDSKLCLPSPKGLETEKHCAGKGQQHIQKTHPSSRQRGRPTKTRS